MKTKNSTINFKTLVDYLQRKLSQEEEKRINFLLLSDEKNYWEFIGLRGLNDANLLEKYLETNFRENFHTDLNTAFSETQITQKKLIDYIQNKLSLEEKEEVKNQIAKDKHLNFELIKLNALFEEDELNNYLTSKNDFVDSILNKIENEFENQSYEYENSQDKNTETTKTISLKRYLSFAASFVLLMVFSFLIYNYFQEKQEEKRLALENKLENKQKENTENQNISTDEYQTLGTDENENIRLEDKLIRRTEDALDIVMTNLSIVAKMTKADKAQNSKLHLDMMREYVGSQNSELDTKIRLSFLDKNYKMTNTIEFSDSKTFFDWIEKQEKVKSVYLKDYTAIMIQEDKIQTDKILIKNGKIEDLVSLKKVSQTADFKVHFTNLVLEIK